MRYSYDESSDSLYIKLVDARAERQQELMDGTIVDIAGDGSLIGVEVLSARTGGWDPGALQQGFPLDDYDLRAVTALALGMGILRMRQCSSAEGAPTTQPAIRDDDLVGIC
jgi:uncharacterized protein YuzE